MPPAGPEKAGHHGLNIGRRDHAHAIRLQVGGDVAQQLNRVGHMLNDIHQGDDVERPLDGGVGKDSEMDIQPARHRAAHQVFGRLDARARIAKFRRLLEQDSRSGSHIQQFPGGFKWADGFEDFARLQTALLAAFVIGGVIQIFVKAEHGIEIGDLFEAAGLALFDAEYIEVLNISESETLDLAGVRFTQGIDFDFTGSAVTSLPPGSRALVVRNQAAFESVYGTGLPIAGTFANDTALSNGGEQIKLEDADNGTIAQFTYDDADPWPLEADGLGRSLELIAPETRPDPALAANWRASSRTNGSPGTADSDLFPADPDGDANGNGEPDLVDYALGNNLGLPEIAPAFETEADGSVLFTYPISLAANRATIHITVSTDLVEWTEGAEYLEAASTDELGDGRAIVKWRIKSSVEGGERLFVRLAVTAE